MIDGAQHPDLIPDLTAYRLYLIAVSHCDNPDAPSEQEVKRQAALLGKIVLKPSDEKATTRTLADFNYQYRNWMKLYNARATEAWENHEQIDLGPLLARRDELIQNTLGSLKGALSHDGWAKFTAYVNGEKRHMKITGKEIPQ